MGGVEGFTRKACLRRSGAAGAALLGGSVWATAPVAARARRADPPIRNLVICCQENRSFDHSFGFAPQVRAKGFGPPPGYSQPDEAGVAHPVFHLTDLTTDNPDHSWAGIHRQYHRGQVDGFSASSGDLLEDAGVTWKIYNVSGVDDILTAQTDNAVIFWSRWADDPRTWASQAGYLADCLARTLPAGRG